MMVSPRRLSLTIGTAIVGVALIGAMLGSRRGDAVDARVRAEEAARTLDSVLATRPDSIQALSLAYLERARLGLGSPFRLVDQSVHDHRLDDSTRMLVAWAILDRVFEHEAYEIDASLLDAIGPRGAGADHLALIERVIGSAPDPRIGETSVRLAYGLASAKGTISATAMSSVVDVAALVRDRALAERDLRRSVSRAKADGVELIDVLLGQRSRRELDVERPLLRGLTANDQNVAIADVPRVVGEIEAIEPDTTAIALSSRSLLPVRLALIAARLGARRPPMAATNVILQTRAAVLTSDSMLAPSVRRYLLAASNEETLVAASSVADRFSGARSLGTARVMLSAAVALRAMAQEPVWFADSPAPNAGEVAGRFALRRIDFDRDVPNAWRPYYVQMAASALEDIRRVMPSFEPTGLAIHFVMRTLPDSALAMHDPRTHTLLLPVKTAGGTLAHELAHDLDWQAARRLFARAGGYASDRSLRERGGALASSIRGLAAANATNGRRGSAAASDRPAEVFARGTDWFVADALAQLGRSNGYLTAIEDQLIGGYTTAMDDAASLSTAPALLNGLAEMTAIPDSIEAGYLERWESVDHFDLAALMVKVREAPVVIRRPSRASFGIPATTLAQLGAPSVCVLERLRVGTPRERLIAWTVDAKSTGILVRRARALPVQARPAWAHAILGEVSWDRHAADDMSRRTTAAVLDGAGRAGLIAMPPAPFLPGC